MRITTAFTLALMTTFAAPAFAQSFVGEWTATAETAGGKVSETLKVVKTGDTVTVVAKLVGPTSEGTPEAGPGTDIVLDGDRFSYKRTIGDLVITYSGVVSGDTFTGAAEIGAFGKVPYNGVRVKKAG